MSITTVAGRRGGAPPPAARPSVLAAVARAARASWRSRPDRPLRAPANDKAASCSPLRIFQGRPNSTARRSRNGRRRRRRAGRWSRRAAWPAGRMRSPARRSRPGRPACARRRRRRAAAAGRRRRPDESPSSRGPTSCTRPPSTVASRSRAEFVPRSTTATFKPSPPAPSPACSRRAPQRRAQRPRGCARRAGIPGVRVRERRAHAGTSAPPDAPRRRCLSPVRRRCRAAEPRTTRPAGVGGGARSAWPRPATGGAACHVPRASRTAHAAGALNGGYGRDQCRAGRPEQGREGAAGVVVGQIFDDRRSAPRAARGDAPKRMRRATELSRDAGEVARLRRATHSRMVRQRSARRASSEGAAAARPGGAVLGAAFGSPFTTNACKPDGTSWYCSRA